MNLLRIGLVGAALFMSSTTASAQGRPQLAWPSWMHSDRWTSVCARAIRQADSRRLVDLMVGKGVSLDEALAQQLSELPKEATRLRRCLTDVRKDLAETIAKGSKNYTQQQLRDLDQAIANVDANLRAYLVAGKERVRTSPVGYYKYTGDQSYWRQTLAGSVDNVRKYDRYLKPAAEACGRFDFPAQPKVGDPELGRRILSRRNCYLSYFGLAYPMENITADRVRELIDQIRAHRLEPGPFPQGGPHLLWRCTGKSVSACFSFTDFHRGNGSGGGIGREVGELNEAKRWVDAFSPYVCSRHAVAGCLPDATLAVARNAVSGPNATVLQKWESRLAAEQATARTEVARIDEYLYVWRYGKSREQLLREQQSRPGS